MKDNRILLRVMTLMLAILFFITSYPVNTAVADDTWQDYENRTSLSDSDNESGLLDTIGDNNLNSIYEKPGGGTGRTQKHSTDLTKPEEDEELDFSDLNLWEQIVFLNYYLGFHLDFTNTGKSEEELYSMAYHATVDDQGAVGDIVGELFYTLASFLEGICNFAGITLDGVIMGRVGGNGALVDRGDNLGSGDDTVISLFHFELEKGNPYGVIAALVYSTVREYMYIIMILVAAVLVIKSGLKSDTPRSKLEFKNTLSSMALILALMVFTPYFLEVYLYLRDVLLSGVVGDSMLELFTDDTNGLIGAFRGVCDDYIELTGRVLWTSAALYLAVIGVTLIFAAMYIANALATLLHVVAFPVVCVKSLSDKKALGAWTWEFVGLTVMPIIDGILLLVPLLFNKFSNGAMALNFISLLACGGMLPARQQFRKSLGLQSNNMMESGGLLTAIGMSRLIGSIGRAGGRAIGQVNGGIKQGASDDAMGNFYDAQAQMDTAVKENAEKQINSGYFNSNGGIAVNPASLSGMGGEAGAEGNLSSRTSGSQVSHKQRMFDEANEKRESHNNAEFISGALNEQEIIANDAATVSGREQDLKAEQIRSILGRNMPVESENNLYDRFATVDNFESQAFANKISNARKAALYRERARSARRQGVTSGVLTAGGAALGGMVGFAATAYMDSGTSAMITSAGIDLGATSGNVYKDISETRRLRRDANRETIIGGDLSDIHYTIHVGRDVPEDERLRTRDRYSTIEPVFGGTVETPVEPEGLEDFQSGFQSPVETQGWYSYMDDLGINVDMSKRYDSSTGEWFDMHGIGVDESRNFDFSTGEWFDKADGSNLHSDATSNGWEARNSVDLRAWRTNVTEDMVNSIPAFKTFMRNNLNQEFTSKYTSTLDSVAKELFEDKSKNAIHRKNYRAAEELTKQFDSVANRSPEEIAKHNAQIRQYKKQTSAMITKTIDKDVSRQMNEFLQEKVTDDKVRESLNKRIHEYSTDFLKNQGTPEYMQKQGWDYDSMMR